MSTEQILEPYDSEIPKIEAALRKCNGLAPRLSFDEFERMVVDEMHQAGFVVRVNWAFWPDTAREVEVPHSVLDVFLAGQKGVALEPPVPRVVLLERAVPEDGFDHDRQRWEVQNDILGIEGGPAVIHPGGLIGTPSKSVSFSGQD